MSGRVGRQRTFDLALVLLAIERRDRTGEQWGRIARDLGVPSGTLQARVSEFRRVNGPYKTPVPPPDAVGSGTDPSGAPEGACSQSSDEGVRFGV